MTGGEINTIEPYGENKALSTLRFITCGSVDDGKSTLIGRMLHEVKCVFDDQMEMLKADSGRYGTQSGEIDYALLVDGLQAEREQGITIDVAYRFFSTKKRRFIVADTPGHEQYTRNMATGASNSDLAIILVDARKGILTQTIRHSRIVSMMGIGHVVLAVNKMDAVDFDRGVFGGIVERFTEMTKNSQFAQIQAIPISALKGDNVTEKSSSTPWYNGPSMLDFLEQVEILTADVDSSFRMPVQYVNRPNQDFRGFCGRVAGGKVRPGDKVVVLPSGMESSVKQVVVWNKAPEAAVKGDSITITLTDEIDVSRGDVIASSSNPPPSTDQFEAQIIWMSARQMDPGRQYLIKAHCKQTTASITEIKYKIDANTGAHLAAKSLGLNEIGVVNVSLGQPVVFEQYKRSKKLGGFILIDKLSFETLGAGMINFALYRSSNIHWQSLDVNKTARAGMKGQKPRCVWLTGLSGAGKSTIANLLDKRLSALGKHTYVLDGDNIRHGLNRDLGFKEVDRVENIRRVAEVAKLMVDAGLIVLVAFISPFREERRMARELFEKDEFIEVFVDTPLEECERRDPKGLFAKARRGELKNFTGVDSPYERPETPEIHLNAMDDPAEKLVMRIMNTLNAQ
ncbi:MAG: sulfate adenylyltransferase subunit CysN [Nitrospinota bacterium]|nr:sulfate adenylyltransferase subunit CysN [Nitrospinota bacterium]